jgi:hypothetical protein
MRTAADRDKLRDFLQKLSERITGPGTIYLVGGSSALALSLRDRTIDIDLKLDPEPPGAFQAIARLRDEIWVNIKLAWPAQFIPELPGWRDRSIYVTQLRDLTVKHYDFYSQVLSKVQRGHDRDVADVNGFVRSGLVFPEELYRLFSEVRDQFIRYPAVHVNELDRRLLQLREHGHL